MITKEILKEEEDKLVEDFNNLFRHQREVQNELDSIIKRQVQIQGALQFIERLKAKTDETLAKEPDSVTVKE